MSKTPAGKTVFGLLLALLPSLVAAEDGSRGAEGIIAGGLAQQRRIEAIDAKRLVIARGTYFCLDEASMTELILAAVQDDKAHFDAVPGCAPTAKTVRVAVLGYPNPIIARLRVLVPSSEALPLIYVIVSAVQDVYDVEKPEKPKRRS